MKVTKANRYPTVEMSAGYYTNPNDYQSTDTVRDYETRANYIGIGISMPLFTGGQLRAQSKQANASYHAGWTRACINSRKSGFKREGKLCQSTGR